MSVGGLEEREGKISQHFVLDRAESDLSRFHVKKKAKVLRSFLLRSTWQDILGSSFPLPGASQPGTLLFAVHFTHLTYVSEVKLG